MTWAGFWALLKAIPALLAFWKEIRKIIELRNKKVDSKKRIEALKEGLRHARETKDTSKIDAIFGIGK